MDLHPSDLRPAAADRCCHSRNVDLFGENGMRTANINILGDVKESRPKDPLFLICALLPLLLTVVVVLTW
jgi:hypothetical protein